MLQPTDGKTINVKTRKGFLNLAMKNGVSIIPVFAFGETKLHSTVNVPGAAFIKRTFHAALVLPVGRFFSFLPFHSVPQNLVIGAPIAVKRQASPTNAQIDALHAEYKEAIRKVFEDHKKEFGHDEFSLNIQ
jgi:2-acylglycerol O-acyltransferase 2